MPGFIKKREIMASKKGITPKQKRFVEEYLIDLNATQAAIRAGYSKKSSREVASRLLTNINVSKAIQKAMEKRSEELTVTQEMVVQELAKIAFANVGDYFEWDGKNVRIKPSGDLTDSQKAAVAEVRSVTGAVNEVSIKLADKQRALALLGRHLGMFDTRIEISGNIQITELEASRERARRRVAKLSELKRNGTDGSCGVGAGS